MKSQIFNLIILDESGSMDCVTRQTISGCNETINTIRATQAKYPDTQEHFVSIFAFQSEGNRPSRYIIKNVPANEVKHITAEDYAPYGMTPLYDAVGSTLTDLKAAAKKYDDAIGSVTIITDGMENSSNHYTLPQVAKMIEGLKELGWNFNFIGANIDVNRVSQSLNIDNAMEFQQSEEGTRAMFEHERRSRARYYERYERANESIRRSMAAPMSAEEREALYEMRTQSRMEASEGYFDEDNAQTLQQHYIMTTNYTKNEYTPEFITKLEPNEIFVFGSNLQGFHGGGAARIALDRFGAVWGQGVGLQGQAYAIPTMQGSVETIKPYVDEFITFAKAHPAQKFLVTRIGCGIAGFTDDEIAPLFAAAKPIDNIILPKSFVDSLISTNQ